MNKVNTTKRIALVARILAVVMLLSCVVPVLSQFDLPVFAADVEFENGGIIVIAESGSYVIDGAGKTIYSITITGDIDVNLFLYNVTIDNMDVKSTKFSGDGTTYFNYVEDGAVVSVSCDIQEALWRAGEYLYNKGYTTMLQGQDGPNSTAPTTTSGGSTGNNTTHTQGRTTTETTSYYVSTCPLLVTDGANATVQMNNTNVFKAGVNGCYVTRESEVVESRTRTRPNRWSSWPDWPDWTITSSTETYDYNYDNGLGYAGIQCDPGATLTLTGTDGSTCNAYGGWQFPDTNIRLNRNDKESNAYQNPTINGLTIKSDSQAGGAGIGGGASYNGTQFGGNNTNNLTFGSSGTVIIDGLDGEFYAQGGHQAAGIGGACNSPAAAIGSSITINSGTVRVQGGRWAAGIGDGDTSNDKVSNDFITGVGTYPNGTYSININGGDVDISGGVAAAGIGTSDKISHNGDGKGEDAESRLEINILGGNVKVRSGFPDLGNNGNYANAGTTLTAAIGAGQNSNMRNNSITIGSGVHLDAASFSLYAISNNGLSAAEVPVVNIDSASHILLCNFVDYASNTNRVIDLHPAQYVVLYQPHTVDEHTTLEELDNHAVLYTYKAGTLEEKLLVEVTISANDTVTTGFTECFLDGEGHYYVAENPVLYQYEGTDPNTGTEYFMVNESYYSNNPDQLLVAHDISYTTNESVSIAQYAVPDYFKAIAITLPEYQEDDPYSGGHYVLELPTDGVSGDVPDKITAGITSTSQGVISGSIDYPALHNMEFDPVTSDLTDIDILVDGVDYIPDENGKPLYSYNVYLPHGTTEADVRLFFTLPGDGHRFKINYLKPTTDTTESSDNPYPVAVSEDAPVTVRVRVTEYVNEVQLSSLTYSIVLYVRANYAMTVDRDDMVYDGSVPKVNKAGVTVKDEGTPIELTDALFNEIVWTFKDEEDNVVENPTNVGTYTLYADLVPKNEPWQAHSSVTFKITPKPLAVTGVELWMQYLKDNSADSLTYKGPFEVGKIYFTGVIGGDTVNITIPAKAGVEEGKAYSLKNIVEQDAASGENYLRLYCVVDNPNYTVAYTGSDATGSYADVMCRIYYDMNGAIFRTDAIGNKWDKFFPVTSDTPLDFTQSTVTGNYQHAQGSHTHTESVFFHSVNNGNAEKRYAVDVEYGSFEFQYVERVWNVNTLEYDDYDARWVGHDGVTNKVTVYNYSNASVNVQLSVSVDEDQKQQLVDKKGIGVHLSESATNDFTYISGLYPASANTSGTVAAATQKVGITAGKAGEKSYYLYMLNSPKFGEASGQTTVGGLTVTISP